MEPQSTVVTLRPKCQNENRIASGISQAFYRPSVPLCIDSSFFFLKKALTVPDEAEVLKDICAANGLIGDDDNAGAGMRFHSVKALEMFLYNYPKMQCLHFFPSLTVLQLTQQVVGDENCLMQLDGMPSWLGYPVNTIER